MIIGTKPATGDASETLCTPATSADEAGGPFALPAVYIALMFNESAPAEDMSERVTA